MARDTLYAIGEALIDMIPSKSGCAFAEVPAFAPRVGGAPASYPDAAQMGLYRAAPLGYSSAERAFFAICHFLPDSARKFYDFCRKTAFLRKNS